MQRPTILVALAAALAPAAIAAGACSFPTIIIAGDTSGSGGGATSSATGATTAGSGGATVSSSSASSTTASATGGSSSASSSASSSSGAVCPADDDLDQVLSWLCGGTDCADEDVNAFPGADYQTKPIKGLERDGLDFDFDCDGTVEAETPVCLPTACPAMNTPAFKTDVPCGMTAALGTCFPVTCTWNAMNPAKSRQQRCK